MSMCDECFAVFARQAKPEDYSYVILKGVK